MLHRALERDDAGAALFLVIGDLRLVDADLFVHLAHSCRTVPLDLTAHLLLQLVGSTRNTSHIPRRNRLKRRHKLLLCARLKLFQIDSRKIL